MDSPPSAVRRHSLEKAPKLAQWLLLLLGSLLVVFTLEIPDIPAALLIGPMLAAIVVATNGATIYVPKQLFAVAQAVLGCLIAMSITPAIVTSFVAEWPIFLAFVLLTLAASSFLGWFVSRLKVLPGTTAVWGTAPGGATAMVVMAAAFGADARLVAFMQYLRVILVSVAAAAIAGLYAVPMSAAEPVRTLFPAVDWPAFGTMSAVVIAVSLAASFVPVPSSYFLLSLIVGALLHLGCGIDLQIPEWLAALSFALIGWTVGLNCTRATVGHAARALPQILASTLALMAFCGGLGLVLSSQLGVDPLTAYLATSPGGLDSIAIIAAASDKVDMSFVMALQSARLLIVIMLGPWLARLVARHVAD